MPVIAKRGGGSDEDDERKTAKSAVTVSEFCSGDSVVTAEADVEEAEGQGEAAVATEKEEKRSKRQPRNITPEQQLLKSKWAARNDADRVGNIGLPFGNWGKRPTNLNMRNHLDKVLKKQPAMVIGLAECQLESQLVLEREPEPAAVAAPSKPGARRKFKNRPELPYLTVRGQEVSSVLIGVRDQAGCALDMLEAECK